MKKRKIRDHEFDAKCCRCKGVCIKYPGLPLRVKRPTVYVEGGILSGGEGFTPGARLDIIDYDNDGTPDADLCKCAAGDGPHSHREEIADKDGKF